MKIAVVHSFYSNDSPSGENIAVLDQVAALERAGHDTRLIAVHTDQLRGRRLYPARAAASVATGRGISPLHELKQFQPDIVHVHNLFPNYSSSWVKAWRGPIVSTVHNFRPMCSAGTLFRDGEVCTLCPEHGSQNAVAHACYRQSRIATVPIALATRKSNRLGHLMQHSDRIITLSRRSRDIYQSYGLDSARIEVVENFRPRVDPSENDDIDRKAPWVFVGRLSPEKGVLELLREWPSEQIIEVYGDGPLRESVQDLQSDSIRVMGRAHEHRVTQILAAAKGLVLPSRWPEGAAPLVYIESLAAGRPVVSRSGNAAADDIVINGGGLIYSSKKQLIEAVNTDKPALDALATQARKNFERIYTEDAWLRRIESVYQEVLNAKS